MPDFRKEQDEFARGVLRKRLPAKDWALIGIGDSQGEMFGHYVHVPLGIGRERISVSSAHDPWAVLQASTDALYASATAIEYVELRWRSVQEQLPSGLRHLRSWKADFERIINLPPGWDEDDALAPTEEIVVCAFQFVLSYALYVHRHFGRTLLRPKVAPCSDNSLDLQWRTHEYELLINIRYEDGKAMAFFFGEMLRISEKIKGNVSALEIRHHFASWLSHLNDVSSEFRSMGEGADT